VGASEGRLTGRFDGSVKSVGQRPQPYSGGPYAEKVIPHGVSPYPSLFLITDFIQRDGIADLIPHSIEVVGGWLLDIDRRRQPA
jgi:hypothetical protein